MIENEELIRRNRRLREKSSEKPPPGLVRQAHTRMAFVYQRLSTHEQKENSIWSLKMQDALQDLAKQDGYLEEMIHVERRDLGISGTLDPDKREGLAYLISQVEANLVESVYVVHISRLYRDQTLIDGLTFGELLRKHSVIIAMPQMRLNLNDRMHMRIWRMELERSADELEVMALRLGGAKRMKALQGLHAGSPIPPGYILDTASQKLAPYEPHAQIIRRIFDTLLEEQGSPMRTLARLRGTVFPSFPPELAFMATRTGLRLTPQVDGGYLLTPNIIKSVATNPKYIGWWIWGGELVKRDNHPPLVDEELFWQVQQLRSQTPKTKGKAVYTEPLMLTGLLQCTNHEMPRTLNSRRSQGRYQCSYDYHSGQGKLCFNIDRRFIEVPIVEDVISRCSFPEFADQVLDELRREQETANAQMSQYRSDVDRLSTQIETLKENLALTKSPEQVQLILDMIEKRTKERDLLLRANNTSRPVVLADSQINHVRAFLSNLKSEWRSLSGRLQNEFLTLVLERVEVTHTRDMVHLKVIWKTGEVQALSVKRANARFRRDRKWTPLEDEILRKHFATSGKDALIQLVPQRTWKAIKARAEKLGLKRSSFRGGGGNFAPPWSDEEEAYLKRAWNMGVTVREIAATLKRTESGVLTRASEKGLKRSKEWCSSIRRVEVQWSETYEETVTSQSIPDGSSSRTGPALSDW